MPVHAKVFSVQDLQYFSPNVPRVFISAFCNGNYTWYTCTHLTCIHTYMHAHTQVCVYQYSTDLQWSWLPPSGSPWPPSLAMKRETVPQTVPPSAPSAPSPYAGSSAYDRLWGTETAPARGERVVRRRAPRGEG